MKVKTRFAPSPTGYLHIGGVRTALYAWLYAKKHQGDFVLRIEDTDQQRSTKEASAVILQAMQWLGLHSDEAVVYQSERLPHYRSLACQLVEQAKAYYCDCSKERLQALRELQLARGEKPRYDGHCRQRGLRATAETVIRLCNPEQGSVQFDDLVRGSITVANRELDDLVLLRSDGVPTYNFAVVIDDHEQAITEVIRGDDHINNTPRQINIAKALGLPSPHYAHLPMILGHDGKRLSKRHAAVSVLDYQQQGFLADALLNYLLRLGWSHGDQEIFSRDEMIALFDFAHVSHSPAAFSQEKLLWLNQHYLKTTDKIELARLAKPFFTQCDVTLASSPDLAEVMHVQRDRAKTLRELVEQSRYFYEAVSWQSTAAQALLPAMKAASDHLTALANAFATIKTWQPDVIQQQLKSYVAAAGLSFGKVAQPLRMALTGGTSSPAINQTIYLLGQQEAVARLQAALAALAATVVDT